MTEINDNIKTVIKNILSAFVCDTAPKPVENVDWDLLYHLSKKHNIDAVLGYMMTKYDVCDNDKIRKAFEKSYMTALLISTNKTVLFSELYKKLASNNIDIAVFKGYILRELYPVAELRTFSDIDMLIHKSDREKSHSLMQESGYEVMVDFSDVYSYKSDLEYYELHVSLLEDDVVHNKKPLDYFADAWSHTQKTADGLYKFDDEFHLLFLIAHIAKHIRYGGAGIRMYLDIALFIKNRCDSFDFSHLMQTAKNLSIEKFAATVLYCSCSWFGLDTSIIGCDIINCVDIKATDDLYSYTIDRGLFGNTKRSSGQATVEMMNSDYKKFPRLSAFLRITVPALSIMKERYAYLEKMPVLLPFAWIQRVFDNKSKIHARKQKLKDIVSTDTAELDRHQAMLDNLGL